MANITKVPDGPLVKKKGVFKGSTLKAGGVIKKAQNGDSLSPYMRKRAEADARRAEIAKKRAADTQRVMNAKGFKTVEELRDWSEKNAKKPDVKQENVGSAGKSEKSSSKGGAAKSPCKGGICPGLNTKSRNGSILKKGQKGIAIDKTFTGPKRNVAKDIKAERTTVTNKNKTIVNKYSKEAKELRDAAGTLFSMEATDNRPGYKKDFSGVGILNKVAKSQDSLANVAKKKPRYKPALKSGGMIKRADGSFSKKFKK